MSRLSPSALAAATVVAVSALIVVFGFGGEDVVAQFKFNATPVLVVNDGTAPVAVVDSSPASQRIAWRQWTLVHLDDTTYRSEPVINSVPKGFRLYITDFNVNACLSLLRDTLAVNLTVWPEGYQADPDMPARNDEIPRNVILLADRGVFRDMRHFGGSQQPNIYLEEGEALWVEGYRTIGRMHGLVSSWVFGYLEPVGARTEPPKGW